MKAFRAFLQLSRLHVCILNPSKMPCGSSKVADRSMWEAQRYVSPESCSVEDHLCYANPNRTRAQVRDQISSSSSSSSSSSAAAAADDDEHTPRSFCAIQPCDYLLTS